MFALVDCNNFFVSCERAFQPELEGLPVVVLSNNDGCVVARSNESKRMGIKMGTPFYQLKHLTDSGRLIVRSSNYTLYGDLSHRVMSILRESAPKIEVYSIDEAFMHLDGIDKDKMTQMCRALVLKIRRWTGIPVSIGIASSKTLAKVANHFAKRYPGYKGVCMIDDEVKMRKALELTPVEDVWGIGWRGAPKLKSMGVHTAADLTDRPASWVYKHMGVTGVRTWQELQGHPVIEEEPEFRKRKSICTSRSFAETLHDEKDLSMRVSDFAGICARKLRQEHSAASAIGVFIHTNRFRTDLPQYYPYAEELLDVPASNAYEVIAAAMRAFRKIYRAGFEYKRAGVVVGDIVDDDAVQGSLFDENAGFRPKADRISEVMDKFNAPGQSLVRLATQRPGHYAEGIRRDYCSRLFSTEWSDLIEIH